MFKVSSANRFETVVGFLSKKLKGMEGVEDGGGVFCYVNSVFAPGLDEGVGGLWRVSLRDSFFCVGEGVFFDFGLWGWGGREGYGGFGSGADVMVCSASRLTINSSWRIP